MGASTMQVQPPTQPTGKGGGNFEPLLLQQGPGGAISRVGQMNSVMRDNSAQSPMTAMMQARPQMFNNPQLSMLTGQPQFGAPNQFANKSLWDRAQLQPVGAPQGKGGLGKGVGAMQPPGQFGGPIYQAPTNFNVDFTRPVTPAPAAAPAPTPGPGTPTAPGYVDYNMGSSA